MNIWTCGNYQPSASRNAWMRKKNFKSASLLNNIFNFLARSKWLPVATGDQVRDLVIYNYDPETKQQRMDWRDCGSPRPPQKIPSAKISWKISRLNFFGIKTAFSSLIIFHRAKLSKRNIIHISWCNWRIFWRKNAAEKSPRISCSGTRVPRLTGHLQPIRNWPTWVSNILVNHPIFCIWTRQTTTCSLYWKTNWKIAIFLPKR